MKLEQSPKLAQLQSGQMKTGGYGHVAYVTDVATDGQIQVTESNYNGSHYPSNIRGFDPTKPVRKGKYLSLGV